ncbi:MAG TPA: hypothetical protein VEK07_24695 [Polyangiaceae bacterium]|nr:hypothetical protein [Polyangiaceae bacterium]
MHAVRFAPAVFVTLVSCNGTRKQECDQFLAAMKPLAAGTPSVELVDTASRSVSAIQFQDQPLREYASSTKATLKTLSETIRLQATPSPPDGTDDLVKAKLKEARGEIDDVTRYCAE